MQALELIKQRNRKALELIFSQESFTELNLAGEADSFIDAEDLEFLASILCHQNNHLISILLPNNIGDVGANWIIDILVNNPCIVHVNLSNNDIRDQGAEYLRDNLQHTNAIHLDLAGHKIAGSLLKGIAEELQGNIAIRNAQLAADAYDAGEGADLTPLKPFIDGVQVDLRYAKHEGFAALTAFLEKHGGKIHHLKISGNEIGEEDEEISMIIDIFREHPDLINIDLSDNNINPEGMASLIKALEGNHALKILDVSQNEIGEEGAIVLANFLKTHSIDTLDVSDTNLGNEGAAVLLKVLSSNKNLKQLYINNNSLNSEIVSELVKFLASNNELEELDISHSHFGDEALINIIEALKSSSVLKKLALSGCKIGPEAIRALSAWLKHNTAITELDISYNDIGDDGLFALIEMLQTNKIISFLDLTAIGISQIGIAKLSEMLKTDSVLKCLSLASNNIDNQDIMMLVDALEVNAALKKLDLEDNKFDNEGIITLSKMLERNHVISYIESQESPQKTLNK